MPLDTIKKTLNAQKKRSVVGEVFFSFNNQHVGISLEIQTIKVV